MYSPLQNKSVRIPLKETVLVFYEDKQSKQTLDPKSKIDEQMAS